MEGNPTALGVRSNLQVYLGYEYLSTFTYGGALT